MLMILHLRMRCSLFGISIYDAALFEVLIFGRRVVLKGHVIELIIILLQGLRCFGVPDCSLANI